MGGTVALAATIARAGPIATLTRQATAAHLGASIQTGVQTWQKQLGRRRRERAGSDALLPDSLPRRRASGPRALAVFPASRRRGREESILKALGGPWSAPI